MVDGDDDGNGDGHENCDHGDHDDGDNDKMTMIVIYVSLLLLMTSNARTVWYLHTKPVLSIQYQCPFIFTEVITVTTGGFISPCYIVRGLRKQSHKLMYTWGYIQ